MALHEMRLIIAKVFWNFDLDLCPESKEWMKSQKVFTLWQKPELRVKVKPVSADCVNKSYR
jgi:cytochrome P450